MAKKRAQRFTDPSIDKLKQLIRSTEPRPPSPRLGHRWRGARPDEFRLATLADDFALNDETVSIYLLENDEVNAATTSLLAGGMADSYRLGRTASRGFGYFAGNATAYDEMRNWYGRFGWFVIVGRHRGEEDSRWRIIWCESYKQKIDGVIATLAPNTITWEQAYGETHWSNHPPPTSTVLASWNATNHPSLTIGSRVNAFFSGLLNNDPALPVYRVGYEKPSGTPDNILAVSRFILYENAKTKAATTVTARFLDNADATGAEFLAHDPDNRFSGAVGFKGQVGYQYDATNGHRWIILNLDNYPLWIEGLWQNGESEDPDTITDVEEADHIEGPWNQASDPPDTVTAVKDETLFPTIPNDTKVKARLKDYSDPEDPVYEVLVKKSSLSIATSFAIVTQEIPASSYSASGIIPGAVGKVKLLDICGAVLSVGDPLEVKNRITVKIPVDTIVEVDSTDQVAMGTVWPADCNENPVAGEARVWARPIQAIDELFQRPGAGELTAIGLPEKEGTLIASDIQFIGSQEC